MKYVIKNCDNYTNFDKDWTCRSIIQNRQGCYCCKDITDCVMKQIVFFCKMDIGSKDNMFLVARYALADLILDMLKIEECE